MGKLYVTLVNISVNSCCLEKYCLLSADGSNLKYEVVGVQTEQLDAQDEEPKNSNDDCGSISCGKGIIKNSRNRIILLHNSEKSYIINQSSLKLIPSKELCMFVDGYVVSLFLFCLNSSQKYVEIVTKHMCNIWSRLCKQHSENLQLSKLQIKLVQPHRHFLDLIWAKMACHTIHELRQLQYAMSWLSTLGGAFSALGEQQERCAKAAGAISIEQLRIALKLGDNIVITQCKLYFSLSLIQRGYCKLAKKIILEQYHNLKNSPVHDKKTLNMSKGIWARLKYELTKRNKAKVRLDSQVSVLESNKKRVLSSQGKVRENGIMRKV